MLCVYDYDDDNQQRPVLPFQPGHLLKQCWSPNWSRPCANQKLYNFSFISIVIITIMIIINVIIIVVLEHECRTSPTLRTANDLILLERAWHLWIFVDLFSLLVCLFDKTYTSQSHGDQNVCFNLDCILEKETNFSEFFKTHTYTYTYTSATLIDKKNDCCREMFNGNWCIGVDNISMKNYRGPINGYLWNYRQLSDIENWKFWNCRKIIGKLSENASNFSP